MAAGLGSRFGGGIKQLAPVGPNGQIIMDYSIHDALTAGFNKLVFIIRRDLASEFREVIGERVEALCRALDVEVCYAYQELTDLPEGESPVPDRVKPWGTGQAVLACRKILHEPFAVINADDYYGPTAYRLLWEFLQRPQTGTPQFCMAGFVLKNTLSANGGVTRGICRTDGAGKLLSLAETRNVIVDADGNVSADGIPLDPNGRVSMNMWGLTPEVLPMLEDGFRDFLRNADHAGGREEFLLPVFIDGLLAAGRASVRVLPTNDSWFGVTYREDREAVADGFRRLTEAGVYSSDLPQDLLRA